MASEHPTKSVSHTHPAFQAGMSTKIPIYIGNRNQRSPSFERKSKISRTRKSRSRETSQEPNSFLQEKSDQRSPEDDSSLLSISGMTSENEYESNISENSEDNKPAQREVKGYWAELVECYHRSLSFWRMQFSILFLSSLCHFSSYTHHQLAQYTVTISISLFFPLYLSNTN